MPQLREEGKKLSAEEAKVRTSFAAKAEAMEESIQAQEAALEVEVEALQGLVSQRERAVQAVVETVKRERAKQEKLLVRLQATAQKDMEHLVKMEPKVGVGPGRSRSRESIRPCVRDTDTMSYVMAISCRVVCI